MTIRRLAIATCLVAALSVAQASAAVAQQGKLAAKQFANCTALNKVYRHGVGMVGAVDHVSGRTRPVTNFYHNNALYRANARSDRDGDKIACEKL